MPLYLGEPQVAKPQVKAASQFWTQDCKHDQVKRLCNKHTHRHTHTDRQTDRQTNTHTHTHNNNNKYTCKHPEVRIHRCAHV